MGSCIVDPNFSISGSILLDSIFHGLLFLHVGELSHQGRGSTLILISHHTKLSKKRRYKA
jgi:hypothetical protein